MQADQALPADIQAERCLLGSLFRAMDPGQVQAVLAVLDPADFADERHQTLAGACLRVYAGGDSCDLLAVRDALGPVGMGKVERLGLLSDVVAELTQVAPSGANALYYARIVRDRAIRRRAVQAADDLRRAAHDQGTDVQAGIDAAARRVRILSGQASDLRTDAAAIASGGDEVLGTMRAALEEQEAGRMLTIPLPWDRLSSMTQALRPGTVCLLAGPACTGKSFFAATIAMGVHDAGADWRYLPLEDGRQEFAWRVLAMHARTFRCIDIDADGVAVRAEALEEHGTAVESVMSHVVENPRRTRTDASGKQRVPHLSHKDVLTWIEQACDVCRVVFVDPVSQIDFDGGRQQWAHEQDFMRQVLGIAAGSAATVMLVTHTVKRPGKAASVPLSLEDIQGSAKFNQLCHTALLLESHGDRESMVLRARDYPVETEHDRTVLVGKARNGRGTGLRLAYRMSKEAPEFDELGIITPKAKGD